MQNESLKQSVRLEHYRLHFAETWPDSPYKDVVLAAIRHKLERFEAASSAPSERPICMVCASRNAKSAVLHFPSGPQVSWRKAA